jgi:prepilin-type N-terminal cleavage/methylation domain-containing protein
MHERGHTLIEMLIVVAILLVGAAVFLPRVNAYAREAELLGAGQVFKGEFRRARSIAVARGTQTALRFETEADGVYLSTYADGNLNGVLAADIRRGVDTRIGRPVPLTTGSARVRVGINPGVRAIPPETGILDTSDPIRFGAGNMLSFSPIGTATPGTLYLASAQRQAAVRVTPGSSRVRLMVFSGTQWAER